MTGLNDVDAFIARWQATGGSERGNYQLFLNELCDLLGVERPQPHAAEERDNAYVYERRVQFRHGDGSDSAGFIDLYRRGAFVLEAKKLRQGAHTRGFDEAMLRARSQAENYARALSADEGRPPFVVVVDVGQRIELYSEFSRSGGTYTPFPDPRSHRIALADLRDEAVRERLRLVWNEPMSLDPSRESARVTREIALRLAELARSLERAKHAPEIVAQFLMRCLFTMFAEDVRLLPKDCFRDLLTKYAEQPDVAMRMLAQLWRDMDGGGFSAVLADDVLQFNGKLFKQPDTLALDRDQLALLLRAAKADWRHVEPAIFGTLLERALSPDERHKLGAHYTPRAYVERLVLPTVIEPLREEWSTAQAAALLSAREADELQEQIAQLPARAKEEKNLRERMNSARTESVDALKAFHHRLCNVRVLDPACGSGNFLYVTLEHLKRLEGEVLNALDELGYRQTGLALDGERADTAAGETVDPHNLLGIELNPRAAAIAEVVLWIGYLQWHFRTRGDITPPVPVIRDFANIENRDAVLAYDRVEFVTDERGVPVTRWDGKTMKVSPVTGEEIPDDSARVALERYVNPRKAAWPTADFVVGNPPFIGNKRMRTALGDGYVEALRGAWKDVPDSADFVMYWWHHSAQLTRRATLQRFGLITTNSIRQSFNRRVIEAALAPAAKPVANASPSSRRKPGSSPSLTTESDVVRHTRDRIEQAVSLAFAVPDHPWVDTADGAAVRISMTVGGGGVSPGTLAIIQSELPSADGEVCAEIATSRGFISPDLRTGTDLTRSSSLRSNRGFVSRGVTLVGKGFLVEAKLADALRGESGSSHIRPFLTGRALTQKADDVFALDFYGLDEDTLRRSHPSSYQWLFDRVRPERLQNNRESYRERWWIFAEPRSGFRRAVGGISRLIVTPRTSKHRFFSFAPSHILFESEVVGIASESAELIGVLSSSVHTVWSLSTGGTLEDRPRYQDGACFAPYPFPVSTTGRPRDVPEQAPCTVASIAEELDAHRKRQQAVHPDLTLTGMYNVLEKLRSGETLTPKERTIHEHGLVSVLRQIHDELDAAVLEAYGWSDLSPLLRIAHGNAAVLPSPSGRRVGDEGGSRRTLPKAPLPAETIAFAREFRQTQTDAEALMWGLLRSRRLHGMKFRRQHPQPPYTLDFYCDQLDLAVELDGSQHAETTQDARRDAALAKAGIEVIRYWNHDVLARTEQVLEDLWQRIDARVSSSVEPPSPPAPLPEGEGGKAMTREDAKRAFDEAILERLVALNAERAAEEARGLVRWLRPEFQNPPSKAAPRQDEIEATVDDEVETESAPVAVAIKPLPWPRDVVEQVRAVAEVLAASPIALDAEMIATRFTARGPWKKRLPQLLQMLVAVGRADEQDGAFRARR